MDVLSLQPQNLGFGKEVGGWLVRVEKEMPEDTSFPVLHPSVLTRQAIQDPRAGLGGILQGEATLS